MMGNMMTDGVMGSRHNEKIKIRIKGAEGGRRTAGRKLDGSSSAVGSIKNTTEEVTMVSSERKWNGGHGS